ncbi:hypothetical protein AB1Y20_000645 [Prymnesium parvum]|uniref:Secreted protein n=1 Tax=Prymnesium parvum TaxID=97485 RepID=A0AB34K9N6_PRYPA
MLAVLLAGLSVQPPKLVVHLILAASKSGGRVPTLDSRLWPHHVEVRRHSIPDTLGACTAEAVSYLRGIQSIYAEVRPSSCSSCCHSTKCAKNHLAEYTALTTIDGQLPRSSPRRRLLPDFGE